MGGVGWWWCKPIIVLNRGLLGVGRVGWGGWVDWVEWVWEAGGWWVVGNGNRN